MCGIWLSMGEVGEEEFLLSVEKDPVVDRGRQDRGTIHGMDGNRLN